LDILKNSNENKDKRKKISGVFKNFSLSGSNIKKLVKNCCIAIGPSPEEGEFNDLIELIYNGREEKIDLLFEDVS
jgi:hypothetical protein